MNNTTQNLRSLIAHTLTEADRDFHGWTFTAEDFKGYNENDLREFIYRHNAPCLNGILETVMV